MVTDVQLTKDHVPVIYHDFLVSETGIDAPVHTLTLEQVSNYANLFQYQKPSADLHEVSARKQQPNTSPIAATFSSGGQQRAAYQGRRSKTREIYVCRQFAPGRSHGHE